MKVCLLRGGRLIKTFSKVLRPSAPLGMAFIAAAVRAQGHAISVIDGMSELHEYQTEYPDIVLQGMTNEEIVSQIPEDSWIICVSCMFTVNWLNDKQLIELIRLRFPSTWIIAGGEHISAFPEKWMNQARGIDICVCGEGESVIQQTLSAIQAGEDLSMVPGIAYRDVCGQICVNDRAGRIRNIQSIERPYWDVFPLEKYFSNKISYGVGYGIRSLPVMATRGCPYRCTFCSSPQMWGVQYSMRDPTDVVDEILSLKERFGINNIDFFDLTAIIKKDWILAFCRLLIERDLNITWQIPAGTRSEAITAEVAALLYASGCRNITYAPETGSPEMLKNIKKKVSLNKMLQSIESSHKAGLNVKINMMIGFPGERVSDILQTIKFLMQASWAGAYDMGPSPFQPYPGSELFQQLFDKGHIDLDSPDYYLELIRSDSFFKLKFYNPELKDWSIRLFFISYLIVFYISNYLFRPQRFLRLFINGLVGKYRSRGEELFGTIIRSYFKPVQKRTRKIEISRGL